MEVCSFTDCEVLFQPISQLLIPGSRKMFRPLFPNSPARHVYGLRIARSDLGYRSLGLPTDIATKGQHCRAEVYLREHGWVPVDPADVRKVVLEEPPGNRPLGDAIVARARDSLFGSWEMNWIAYNYAHDVDLPGSANKPLVYFMYPQAETSEGRIDPFDPANFKYEITAREII